MGKTLEDLIGSSVKRVVVVHDYMQLLLDRAVVNLYNPIVIPSAQIGRLTESTVTCVEVMDGSRLIFRFNGSSELHMSLLAEDFRGPEAATVFFDTGEIIVVP